MSDCICTLHACATGEQIGSFATRSPPGVVLGRVQIQMLELPEVSVLTEFRSSVSPDPASVSTGQLLATLPDSSGNWLPKHAGFQQALEFPSLPYPALCVSYGHPCIVRPPFFLYPSPHCAFPQLRTLLRIGHFPIYPTPPRGVSLCLSYLSPSPHCAITLIPLSLWPLSLSYILCTPFPELSLAQCELPRMARHIIPSLFGLVPVCTSGELLVLALY